MRLTILMIAVTCLAACKQTAKAPENFDYGKIENGVYSNAYFNFEIPVPATWAVQDREEVKQLQKQGQEMISGSDKELAAKIKAADIRTAIFLTVFKNKVQNATGEFNPSFIILSENLGNVPGVKRGNDYLEHAKSLMQQSAVNYEFSPKLYTEKIGNKEFDGMDVVMNASGVKVQQTYYSIIDKNFAVSIIISSGNDQQKAELKDIISKIKFK